MQVLPDCKSVASWPCPTLEFIPLSPVSAWTKYEFAVSLDMGLQASTWQTDLRSSYAFPWPGLGFVLLQLVCVAKVPACSEFQPTWIMAVSILFLLLPSLCLLNLSCQTEVWFQFIFWIHLSTKDSVPDLRVCSVVYNNVGTGPTQDSDF